MKYAAVSVAILLSFNAAQAQSPRTESVIIDGKSCTRTTDANGNVATMCGSNNSATFGSPHAIQGQGFAPPNPNQGGVSPPTDLPDWTRPHAQQGDRQPSEHNRPDLTTVLVGRWHYTLTSNGTPLEVIAIFSPDSTYVEYMRFTARQEIAGNQVMTERGRYTVDGNSLTTMPSEITVANGPSSNQVCNLRTQKCFTPPLNETDIELQVVNSNTISGEIGEMQFTAQRMRQ
jgi:hypothetical protein